MKKNNVMLVILLIPASIAFYLLATYFGVKVSSAIMYDSMLGIGIILCIKGCYAIAGTQKAPLIFVDILITIIILILIGCIFVGKESAKLPAYKEDGNNMQYFAWVGLIYFFITLVTLSKRKAINDDLTFKSRLLILPTPPGGNFRDNKEDEIFTWAVNRNLGKLAFYHASNGMDMQVPLNISRDIYNNLEDGRVLTVQTFQLFPEEIATDVFEGLFTDGKYQPDTAILMYDAGFNLAEFLEKFSENVAPGTGVPLHEVMSVAAINLVEEEHTFPEQNLLEYTKNSDPLLDLPNTISYVLFEFNFVYK